MTFGVSDGEDPWSLDNIATRTTNGATSTFTASRRMIQQSLNGSFSQFLPTAPSCGCQPRKPPSNPTLYHVRLQASTRPGIGKPGR